MHGHRQIYTRGASSTNFQRTLMTTLNYVSICKPQTVVKILQAYWNESVRNIQSEVQTGSLVAEVDRLKSDLTEFDLDVYRVADAAKVTNTSKVRKLRGSFRCGRKGN